MIGAVDLRSRPEAEQDVWRTLLELAGTHPRHWCIVGAQMVLLHARAAGVDRPVVTRDADLVVDIRALQVAHVARFLERRGFTLDGVSPEGIGHRLVRGQSSIDVLSIDSVGDRADLTTIPPARTVQVPGSRRAMQRLASVRVQIDSEDGELPLPDRIGALVVKARAAVSFTEQREKHLQDLALLLALPIEIESLVTSLTGAERRDLVAAFRLIDEDSWRAVAHVVEPLTGRAAMGLISAASD